MLKNLTISRPLAVIDLETTGTDPKEARIVEVSVLKLSPGGGVDHRTRRVNPGVPIPAGATEVHGITDADVAGMPGFSEIAPGLLAFLDGCDLCGYNVRRYDVRVLINELKRVGRELALHGRRIVDPMLIYQAREKRDLAAALKFYCERPHDGAHGAAADVLATIAILDAQVLLYDDLPRSLDELHAALADPDGMDLDEKFKRVDGAAVFNFGKYQGQSLDSIARDPRRREYLDWMLGQDFYDDVKAIIRAAQISAG